MLPYCFLTLLLVALFAPMATAQAAVITKCGASKGFGYYFDGPLVPSGKSGWTEDGVSGGDIRLIQDGKELDIVVGDTLGTRSMKADGFQVFSIRQPKPGFVLVVAISGIGVVEHYLFHLDALGNGTVVWGTVKGSGARIQKSAIYKATCHSP